MARPRPEGSPSSYQPEPPVPAELAQRYDLVSAVLAKQLTTSEAARRLGISRPNMQTLVHRVKQAMIEALTPRPTGPKPRPARELALEAENAQLRKRVAKLESQLRAADEMMGAAGEIIRSLRGLPPMKSPRSSTGSPRATRPSPSSDEDPEPPPPSQDLLTRFVVRVATLSDLGTRAARVVGVGAATLRRWLGRVLLGEPIQRPRGGRREPASPGAERSIRHRIRELGGLIGAAALAHSVSGVSRRTAAQLKHDELTAIERERKAACARVVVTQPGVVRGFDAMHVDDQYALIAADAAVPFRTSAVLVPTYDAPHVAATLDADFAANGAPLVLRYDRASCHDAESVIAVLRAHRVLPLHGPAHHPQYYAQLERQNREHRHWLAHHAADDLCRMTSALNELWPRPTLAWRTPAALWATRRPLEDDRDQFHQDVLCRAYRLRAGGVHDDMAWRLAIEQALTQRGYLRITPGRRVLCE